MVWRDQPERIDMLRLKLGSLSEYMKALNEFIAKKANRESGRKGNFWDDRIKCQRLEDEGALLSAMVYVDLNPIRAKLAEDLPGSDHTSVQRRLRQMQSDRRQISAPLKAIVGPNKRRPLDLTQAVYLELVDQTGRQLHPGKRGRISVVSPPVLKTLGLNQRQWLTQVKGIERRYWRAVGSVESLVRLAEQLGQRWVRGIVGAKALQRMR